MNITVDAIYAGSVRAMPNDGRPTGIFKQTLTGEVEIGVEGIVGDAQADRRVHGGPEKALHHFPAERYAQFAELFPERATLFTPGSIGENLSTQGWTEQEVCIGDVFALGTARIQLNQPRSPCWKIDARYDVEGLTQHVEAQGVAGWYYRVLTPGRCRAGDALRLEQRNADAISLAEYWHLRHAHRPDPAALRRLIATPGLAPDKAVRWQQRLDWLSANGGRG